MYSYHLKSLPKETTEIILKIPKETIFEESKKVFIDLQKHLVVPGFRSGKIPKKIAEKHISKEKIYQEVIKRYLPKVYQEITDKEKLIPIVNPKIDLIKAKEGEDWEIKIIIAGRPKVDLKNYREAIKKIINEDKKTEIWLPGKDKKSPSAEEREQKKLQLLNKILDQLLKTVDCQIADIIIEEELNRRLSQLVDDVQKLGLTIESYLKTKKITYEEIKNQYQKEIENTYKLEFILQAIADAEKIEVNKEDLDRLFSSIKDEKQRKEAEQNGYLYASILRKQKTLDHLLSL